MNFLFPKIAYAMDIATLMARINRYIFNPLIMLLFGVAMVIFIYGLVEFLSNSESEEVQTKGKQHMLWGVVGMFIMISVFGIMNLLINTFGFTTSNGTTIIIPKAE